LNPLLRAALTRRVDALQVNPLEHDDSREARAAMAQYDAFMTWARDGGLEAKLDAERSGDARAAVHGAGGRLMLRAATVATIGLYRHRDDPNAPQMAERIDASRREENRRVAGLPPLPPVSASARPMVGESAQ
jgi:hypothetical protein